MALLHPHRNNAGAQSWRNASQEPVGLAPDPAVTTEAVIQVYTARTWGWRGYFGVHPWIAVKPTNADAFTVYEVIGWRLRWGENVVSIRPRVAHVAREVPELKIDLPPTAIGKDYLGPSLIAQAPSGTGYQFSLGGLLGVMASRKEGLEINILGLVFGVNPFDPSIKLPSVGRIGPPRKLDFTAPSEMTGSHPDKLIAEKPL